MNFSLLMWGPWAQRWGELDATHSHKPAPAGSNTPLKAEVRLFYHLWLGLRFSAKNTYLVFVCLFTSAWSVFACSFIFIHITSLFFNRFASWEPYFKMHSESLYVIMDRCNIYICFCWYTWPYTFCFVLSFTFLLLCYFGLAFCCFSYISHLLF